MAGYHIYWITENLGVGHMPFSDDDFNDLRAAGVSAIVNLCWEYCDLHEIQRDNGFDVHYLPVQDEHAPEQAALEAAIAWIDSTIAAGKKVLVHCRFGIGRTGTVLMAYLLAHGSDMKTAESRAKMTRAVPSSHEQWQFLKKYASACRKKRSRTARPPDSKGRAANVSTSRVLKQPIGSKPSS